jgi:nucleoid DNA-binding protein
VADPVRHRSDLVKQVSRRVGMDPDDVDRVVVAALEQIADDLAAGRDVSFRTFGVFTSRVLAGFVRPNPRDGHVMQVPGRATVTFRPSVTLKRRLNAV